jgi:hypothetical protein
VGRLLPGAPRVEADLGIKHLHGDPRIADEGPAQPKLGEIHDADLVGCRDRAQAPPPDAEKVERAGLPKFRKEPA